MLKKTQNQKGSIHVIITVILVLLIITALGFVLWRNFLDKPATKSTSTTSKQEVATQADDTVKLTKTHCFTQDTLCFKYPDDWSVTSKDDGPNPTGWEKTSVSNKKGESLVSFNIEVDGIGGTGIGTYMLYINAVGSTGMDATVAAGKDTKPIVVASGVVNNYVTQSEADENGIAVYNNWYPLAFLTTQDGGIQVGKTTNAGPYVGLVGFGAKTEKNVLGPSAGDNGASITWPTKYASRDEAQKAYESIDFQTAYKILVSTYWK